MTRTQLKTLTKELMGGYELSDTLFDSLVVFAQSKYESLREWKKLESVDETKTLVGGNTFLTAKAMPTDFILWQSKRPVYLFDNGNNEVECKEIPMAQRRKYKDTFGKYYVDYKNSNVYFCGSPPTNYTIAMNYIAKAPDVSASQEWIFPSFCHGILAYDISVNYKGGIDYDPISESQARYNQQQIDAILANMIQWDAKLQNSALEGQEEPSSNNFSGRINFNG